MEKLKKAKIKAQEVIDSNGWIKWIHHDTKPAHTTVEKQKNAFGLGNHCSTCLNLNGCCFPTHRMPRLPLHSNCHCDTEPISRINYKAHCELNLFTKYIFASYPNNVKKDLLESWGYGIMDSEWLCTELINQAKTKYAQADFNIGRLDSYGQRISIVIILPRKDKIGVVHFNSSWMVCPDGVIKIITPYGGR